MLSFLYKTTSYDFQNLHAMRPILLLLLTAGYSIQVVSVGSLNNYSSISVRSHAIVLNEVAATTLMIKIACSKESDLKCEVLVHIFKNACIIGHK